MLRAMSSSGKMVLSFYQRMVKRHLTAVQSIQTGSLMLVGDLIAQHFVEKAPLSKLDIVRTTKFGLLGVLYVGPAVSTWYRFLATRVTRGTKTVITVKKVALDQLVFAPLFLPSFIIILNLINWKTWNQITNELRLKYAQILLVNYKVWPLTQLINFGLVPLQYQVLLAQTVAIFWNAYLSYKTQAKTA